MKPTKNRIYCKAEKRRKMLFDSQSEADNFMKFNSDQILEENGKAPVRSYYCSFCLGWHLTSNPSKVAGEIMDAKDNNLINKIIESNEKKAKIKEDIKQLAKIVSDKLIDFECPLKMGEYSECEDILEICSVYIEDMRSLTKDMWSLIGYVQSRIKFIGLSNSYMQYYNAFCDKAEHFNKRVMKARERMKIHISIYNMSKEEQDALTNVPELTREQLDVIINDCRALKEIKDVIEHRDNLIHEEDAQMVNEKISMCRKHIKSLSGGVGVKLARVRLNAKLEAILKARKTPEGVSKSKPTPQTDNSSPEHPVKMPIVHSSEYKEKICDLNSMLEKIQKAFENEDYTKCEDMIDTCNIILEDLRSKEPGSEIDEIQSKLGFWENKLNTLYEE